MYISSKNPGTDGTLYNPERTGAPTSRVGQRVNTHTIQRCCVRNQCEFGTLNNINLF